MESETSAQRQMLRRILLWLLPTVTVLVCGYLYGMSGRYATTDNAYLQQDRVDVVAQIPGNVSSVEAMENSAVKAGQVILTLEDATQRMLVAAAESKLDAARADVRALQAAIHEKTGELEVARRAAEFSDRDLKRQKELADRKLISVAQLDSAERTAELSSGSIAVLKLQLAQTLARLGGNANAAVDSYPVVANALADLARARLDLDRTVVRAPQAGIVSHLPKVGSRLDMGRTAFAIITTDRLWVEANFKETDLEWVRPGQRVTVDVDTYSHRHWTGHVESIAQATGSSFALLPAQNASGNWVKVVQRIPVRIALDRRSDDPPLRNGMSASVSIDTGGHTRIDRWLGR